MHVCMPRVRMADGHKFIGKRTLILFAIGYALLVAVMFIAQRSYMYIPYKIFPNPALMGVGDMDAIEVTTADGLTLKALYKAPVTPSMPVVVLFHGNGGSIAIRGSRARDYIDHGGYGFLLAEYRGYAGNPGKPSEQGLYEDARAYMVWLTDKQKIAQDRIVLYGESLGTGIATQMALEYANTRALVLEAPYTTMQAIAQKHMFWLPAYWLVLDRYNNIDKIAQVRAPLLVLHGKKDNVVPFSHGAAVFQNAKADKRMEVFSEGNHVNLHQFGAGDKVRHFLAAHPSD